MNLEHKLEEIIKPICDEMNLYLLEVKVKGDWRNAVFQIFADNEKGITLGECAKLTRIIQDEIDMDESFRGNYRLDVSSPGIGHPLKYDFEYKKNIGRTLIVSEFDGNKKHAHEGALQELDTEFLTLVTEQGENKIARKNIEQAKVKVQW